MPTGIITLDTASSLATLEEAFDFVKTGFTEMASALLSTPLFLIPVGIFVFGACIGLVKRLV